MAKSNADEIDVSILIDHPELKHKPNRVHVILQSRNLPMHWRLRVSFIKGKKKFGTKCRHFARRDSNTICLDFSCERPAEQIANIG